MGKKAKRARQRSAAGSGGSGAATPKKFTAPTSGLEDVYFTWGTAKDAAKQGLVVQDYGGTTA